MILLRTSGDLFSWEKMKMTPATMWSLKQFNIEFFFSPFPIFILEINIKIPSG